MSYGLLKSSWDERPFLLWVGCTWGRGALLILNILAFFGSVWPLQGWLPSGKLGGAVGSWLHATRCCVAPGAYVMLPENSPRSNSWLSALWQAVGQAPWEGHVHCCVGLHSGLRHCFSMEVIDDFSFCLSPRIRDARLTAEPVQNSRCYWFKQLESVLCFLVSVGFIFVGLLCRAVWNIPLPGNKPFASVLKGHLKDTYSCCISEFLLNSFLSHETRK